jgi:GNAT superfamily N-acetyltransferase
VVTIRNATVADARPLGAVHVASWQAAYRGILSAAYLDGLSVEHRARMWHQMLTEGSTVAVACDETGAIVAFSSYGTARGVDEPNTGEVYAIYADPMWWDRGVGGILMDAAVDALRAGGFTRSILWVLEDNTRACRFYERRGWTFDGVAQDETIGTDVRRELRYARQL